MILKLSVSFTIDFLSFSIASFVSSFFCAIRSLSSEISSFLSIMRENHYFEKEGPWGRSILSFEVRPVLGENPKEILEQSKEEFLKAWAFFETLV